MRKSRFTETQIGAILKEADAGLKVKDLCRKHGISAATCYKWKSKYGGMDASDLKRVKELESSYRSSSVCTQSWLARTINEGVDRKKALTPSAQREAAAFLVAEQGLTVASGCRCAGLSRSAWYRVPDDWTVRDAEIIGALAALVEGRPSRGFWKCRKLLRRQGQPWNH